MLVIVTTAGALHWLISRRRVSTNPTQTCTQLLHGAVMVVGRRCDCWSGVESAVISKVARRQGSVRVRTRRQNHHHKYKEENFNIAFEGLRLMFKMNANIVMMNFQCLILFLASGWLVSCIQCRRYH